MHNVQFTNVSIGMDGKNEQPQGFSKEQYPAK